MRIEIRVFRDDGYPAANDPPGYAVQKIIPEIKLKASVLPQEELFERYMEDLTYKLKKELFN
jgi:hypothetical protein